MELGTEILTGVRSRSETFISDVFSGFFSFGTSSGHSLKYFRGILVNFLLHFMDQYFQKLFQTMTRGGTKTGKVQEKSSEMNVSERDLIPVKISAPNSKNSRSYSIFTKVVFLFASEEQIVVRGR